MENQQQQQQQQAQQPAQQQIAPRSVSQYALTEVGQSEKAFALAQRKATMYAQSTIVPATYQNNVSNCVIALDMAERMGANPLMVMQNLYVVHGMPSFSSKFLIACINASKRFSPLRYEFTGDPGTPQYGCRCYAYESGDSDKKEPLHGDWITLDMAQKEGWSTKNGSKWATMPGQMLRYRAAAFWQRVYCPEISMGLITTEEAEEIPYSDYEDVTNAAQQEIAANANSGAAIGFETQQPQQQQPAGQQQQMQTPPPPQQQQQVQQPTVRAARQQQAQPTTPPFAL